MKERLAHAIPCLGFYQDLRAFIPAKLVDQAQHAPNSHGDAQKLAPPLEISVSHLTGKHQIKCLTKGVNKYSLV